jgi:hypothetical protein
MGRQNWEQERADAIRQERWSLTGPNRIVKSSGDIFIAGR